MYIFDDMSQQQLRFAHNPQQLHRADYGQRSMQENLLRCALSIFPIARELHIAIYKHAANLFALVKRGCTTAYSPPLRADRDATNETRVGISDSNHRAISTLHRWLQNHARSCARNRAQALFTFRRTR